MNPAAIALDETFRFGRGQCCGKPVGCAVTGEGCLCLRHPWKRAVLFADPAAPCPKASQQPHPETGVWVRWGCVLLHGHDGACELRAPPLPHGPPDG